MFPEAAPLRIPGVSPFTRSALQALFGALTWVSPRLAARVALLLFIVPCCPRVNSLQRGILRRAEALSVAFQDGQLRVYRWRNDGPTILLAHGWSSRAARLTGLVTPLVNAGFQVIAFDAPGHGASTGWCADMQSYQRAFEH